MEAPVSKPRLRRITTESLAQEVKLWIPAVFDVPEAELALVLDAAKGNSAITAEVVAAYRVLLRLYTPFHPGVSVVYPWEDHRDPSYELDAVIIAYHGRVRLSKQQAVTHGMLAAMASLGIQTIRNAICQGELVSSAAEGRYRLIDADLACRWLDHRRAEELRLAHATPKVAS